MSSTFPPPSAYEQILFQSRLLCDATAVEYGAERIGYPDFVKDIERAIRRVRQLQLAPGTRVGLYLQDAYLQWVITLALMREGIVSVCLGNLGPVVAFTRVERVFVHALDAKGVEPARPCPVSRDWLEGDGNDTPIPDSPPLAPDAPLRMVLSSGTTGRPKKVLLSRAQVHARSRGVARHHGVNAGARLLSGVGPATIGGFIGPLTTWANGGTVVLPRPRPDQGYGAMLVEARPNVVFLSPAQLASALDSLPPGYWTHKPMSLYVAGGVLPSALSARARQRLSPSLFVLYGSTETGTVTLGHAAQVYGRPGCAGFVVPQAQVEIVDEAGKALPPGSEGEIRLRTEPMADGYADETERDSAFREGWFYPGDMGRLEADGTLSVLGRTVELMNLGGTKIAPELVEAALASAPGVLDLAAFSMQDHAGVEYPWIAVVGDDSFDDKQLRAQFRARFSEKLGTLRVARFKEIPRNEMGKVSREKLREVTASIVANLP